MEENYNINQQYYEVLPIRNNVVYPGVMMPIAIAHSPYAEKQRRQGADRA